MSALALSLLAISILILAAVLLYIGRSIAKCVELNKANNCRMASPKSEISEVIRGQIVTVWVAIYTQSTTLHNDVAKFLRVISIGAVGIGITLLSKKIVIVSANSSDLWSNNNAIFALLSLGLSLLFTIGPLETLAYKQRDLANDLRSQLHAGSPLATVLPDCKIPRKYHVYGMFALVFLFIGIILLVFAASNSKL